MKSLFNRTYPETPTSLSGSVLSGSHTGAQLNRAVILGFRPCACNEKPWTDYAPPLAGPIKKRTPEI
jgi:hypothetical protein